ncbi:MAG TPA: 2-oxoacid:acceptor oxidoreductase family protein [Methanoregulaceae archaeon]|nr:2-oxoacid:acceptor oxidoreductase family protein [Methanoregulaceae archaeon]HOV68238.1 2-oxoacid:acceptor oxidoreductase family protein [Methanoregulaceae archaeon]HQJ88540.1 2-oxoacid:acceptor oxidoreductase family protein [Methanoregulaceae archaeon]
MRRELRLSGFGGQGIMLAAVILGRAAVMYDRCYAVQTQVYGPEARGGASMAAVVFDDSPILYPEVTDPDILVIMSQEGFEKYGTIARQDAVMLLDPGLVHSRPACRYYEIPATDDARSILGKVIVANIVMLGALVASTGVVSRDAIERAVLDQVPRGTEDLNLRALRQGYVRGEEARG